MHSIKEIQAILDQAHATTGQMTKAQISRKIISQDPVFLENCLSAKTKQNKSVQTPFGLFESQKAFNKWADENKDIFFGVKVGYWGKSQAMPHLYYKVEKGPGKIKYENVYYTPYGIIGKNANTPGLSEMMKKAAINREPCAVAGGDSWEWFQKMKRKDPDNYYVKKEPKREWSLE